MVFNVFVIRTIYSFAPWARCITLQTNDCNSDCLKWPLRSIRDPLQLTELLVTMNHCPLAHVAFHIRPAVLLRLDSTLLAEVSSLWIPMVVHHSSLPFQSPHHSARTHIQNATAGHPDQFSISSSQPLRHRLIRVAVVAVVQRRPLVEPGATTRSSELGCRCRLFRLR
jgi:hypothetical protein